MSTIKSNNTIIEAKNIEVTEGLRDATLHKLEKVHHHFDSLIKNHEIKVFFSVIKNRKGKNQSVEVTINLNGGHVVRCHAAEEDAYAAIDTVIYKLERQLRKFKTRLYNRIHTKRSVKEYGLGEDFDFDSISVPEDYKVDVENYTQPKIIKTKRYVMEPLDPDMAVEKLDDCGHPFYMFLNIFTNRIAAVYKREDGNYGLIEPEHLEVNN